VEHEDPVTSPIEITRESVVGALGGILSTRPGRLWLWNLLAQCNIFASTFRKEAHMMVYLEGRCSLGLEILADIATHYPERYLQMISESRAVAAGRGE